ncbi:hypothetical protein B0H13DRAFT_2488789 [Mycena leptocephala]|nr:hypothetical protein B0H13DRAFT_2488789 [Mycena leptocephala]
MRHILPAPTMDSKDWALATLLQSTDQDIEDYKRWLHKKAAAARLKDLKSQKKTLGRVPRHSGSSKAGSASLIPKLVGNSADSEDDTDKSDSEGELADSSSQFSQAIPSSPISSPLPILSAVDSESDFLPVKTPSLASFGDGNPSPVPEYTQPQTPQTSAEFDSNLFMVDPAAQFPAYSSFTDDELMKLLDGCSGFELEWLTIGTALDLNTDAGMAASALDTTLHENWPTLPPVPSPSPPQPSSDSAVALPPATRKRTRDEVDMRNVVDEPRTRKIRYHKFEQVKQMVTSDSI